MAIEDAELRQIIEAIKQGFKESGGKAGEGVTPSLPPRGYDPDDADDIIAKFKEMNELLEDQKDLFRTGIIPEGRIADEVAGVNKLDEAVKRMVTDLGALTRATKENQILAELR